MLLMELNTRIPANSATPKQERKQVIPPLARSFTAKNSLKVNVHKYSRCFPSV